MTSYVLPLKLQLISSLSKAGIRAFRWTDLYDIAGRGLSASEKVGNMMLPTSSEAERPLPAMSYRSVRLNTLIPALGSEDIG